MPPDYMEEKQWERLVRSVDKRFDDLTLKRGFQYYKQERVRSLAAAEDGTLQAVVVGSEPYRVHIDLEQLEYSDCNCPVSGFCKHMAAALMAYADRIGMPVQELANAKVTQKLAAPRLSKTGQQAADRQAARAQAAKLPEMTLAEWREWFALCLRPLEGEAHSPHFASAALRAILSAAPPDMPPGVDQLFRFHAKLYVLMRLVNPYRSSAHHFGSYLPYYADLAASELLQEINADFEPELALEGDGWTPGTGSAGWARLHETMDFLRTEALKESFSDRPCLRLCYYWLWMCWLPPLLTGLAPVKEELAKLHRTADELGELVQPVASQLLRCRIHFYLGEDEAAWGLLRLASEKHRLPMGELGYYPYEAGELGQWSRMRDWLRAIGPLLGSYRHNVLNEYFSLWERLIPHLPEAETDMWDTLVDMLPATRFLYEGKLREHERWRDWIDYQLSIGGDPLEYRVGDLQPIEKASPALLLPFYHQAIERHVLTKNRQGYKQAAKLLKRLAKLYKKLKQEERWERFFDGFLGRNSRLRALQEELRKGKLIP